MIRLGFEEILSICQEDGSVREAPSAWFFGRQGERSDYTCYSDKTYKDIKRGRFSKDVRWYLMELGCHTALNFTDEEKNFKWGLYKDFIEREETFLVPIHVTSTYPERDFVYLETKTLPEDLLEYIHRGKATVLFFSHPEGNIDYRWVKILNTFCRNNKLSREEAWLSASDLNIANIPFIERNFGVRALSYFSIEHWFGRSHDEGRGGKAEDVQYNLATFRRYLKENESIPKEKTFLSLNRRCMPHRYYITGYMLSDPDITNKSFISLGTSNIDGFNKDNPFLGRHALVYLNKGFQIPEDERPKELVAAYQYFLKHKNECVLRQLDREDLDMTSNPTEINENLYRKAFVNIITETYCDCRGYIFLTEKTFKTIYSMMPFLLCASTGTLEALHKLGYQTFSAYWDESYDSIESDAVRLSEVCKIIKKLSVLPPKVLLDMTRDMEPILYHNARLLASTLDLEETLGFLESIQDRKEKLKTGEERHCSIVGGEERVEGAVETPTSSGFRGIL